MTIRVEHIVENPNDILMVFGARVEGEIVTPLVAQGWVSATQHHFDPEDYWTAEECPADLEGEERAQWLAQYAGHRKDEATPRQMTPQEIQDYAARLLAEKGIPVVPPRAVAPEGSAPPAPGLPLPRPSLWQRLRRRMMGD